jgi:hypothetical protein
VAVNDARGRYHNGPEEGFRRDLTFQNDAHDLQNDLATDSCDGKYSKSSHPLTRLDEQIGLGESWFCISPSLLFLLADLCPIS